MVLLYRHERRAGSIAVLGMVQIVKNNQFQGREVSDDTVNETPHFPCSRHHRYPKFAGSDHGTING
jgi:alpha-D-ribose 1-methylphosphonate 5-triphosphate synthase subunit PhnI